MAKKRTPLKQATAPPSSDDLVKLSLEDTDKEPVQPAILDEKPDRIVQMNIRVPESLRTRLKIRCLETGKDMQDVIADLIRGYLE